MRVNVFSNNGVLIVVVCFCVCPLETGTEGTFRWSQEGTRPEGACVRACVCLSEAKTLTGF